MLTACVANGTWVDTAISGAMLLLTVFSVICAFRAYKHQKDRSKKEAACKLAKHYASSIIDKYSDISSVFEKSGVNNEIKQAIDIGELERFDAEEMQSILLSRQIDVKKFCEKISKIDPEAIYATRMSAACSVLERELFTQGYTKKEEDGTFKIKNGHYLQTDFKQEIGSLLNELEWFAMNCRYGLADEEMLYQSLHQSYLSTVWMLSFFISIQNTNNEDKVFTNVIWLFNKWRDRLDQITGAARAEQQEFLERAKAVKPKEFSGKALK